MDNERSAFWGDLAQDLQDPAFLREYVAQSVRVATIDQIINELDEARLAAGLAKSDLARAISVEPSTIRRLFSASRVNPTLGTLAEVAAALGMRVVLEPLNADDQRQITQPLRGGSIDEPRRMISRLGELRRAHSRPLAAGGS